MNKFKTEGASIDGLFRALLQAEEIVLQTKEIKEPLTDKQLIQLAITILNLTEDLHEYLVNTSSSDDGRDLQGFRDVIKFISNENLHTLETITRAVMAVATARGEYMEANEENGG